jgi:hypothetical protein
MGSLVGSSERTGPLAHGDDDGFTANRIGEMPNRRDLIALGALATSAALTGTCGASAAPPSTTASRLETVLFNLKDGLSSAETADCVARFKDRALSSGGLIGRNFIPTPFPTRFEWIYMAQFDADPLGDAAYDRFKSARDELAARCRNQARCDLNCPLPPRFADARGVTVRHTVMFDFKPDAPPEARERNVAAIRAMGRLPMVQAYLVEPSARSVSGPDQMQWQVVGDFASVADYRAYSQAPVHLAIKDDFTAHTSRVAFLDVQL